MSIKELRASDSTSSSSTQQPTTKTPSSTASSPLPPLCDFATLGTTPPLASERTSLLTPLRSRESYREAPEHSMPTSSLTDVIASARKIGSERLPTLEGLTRAVAMSSYKPSPSSSVHSSGSPPEAMVTVADILAAARREIEEEDDDGLSHSFYLPSTSSTPPMDLSALVQPVRNRLGSECFRADRHIVLDDDDDEERAEEHSTCVAPPHAERTPSFMAPLTRHDLAVMQDTEMAAARTCRAKGKFSSISSSVLSSLFEIRDSYLSLLESVIGVHAPDPRLLESLHKSSITLQREVQNFVIEHEINPREEPIQDLFARIQRLAEYVCMQKNLLVDEPIPPTRQDRLNQLLVLIDGMELISDTEDLTPREFRSINATLCSLSMEDQMLLCQNLENLKISSMEDAEDVLYRAEGILLPMLQCEKEYHDLLAEAARRNLREGNEQLNVFLGKTHLISLHLTEWTKEVAGASQLVEVRNLLTRIDLLRHHIGDLHALTKGLTAADHRLIEEALRSGPCNLDLLKSLETKIFDIHCEIRQSLLPALLAQLDALLPPPLRIILLEELHLSQPPEMPIIKHKGDTLAALLCIKKMLCQVKKSNTVATPAFSP